MLVRNRRTLLACSLLLQSATSFPPSPPPPRSPAETIASSSSPHAYLRPRTNPTKESAVIPSPYSFSSEALPPPPEAKDTREINSHTLFAAPSPLSPPLPASCSVSSSASGPASTSAGVGAEMVLIELGADVFLAAACEVRRSSCRRRFRRRDDGKRAEGGGGPPAVKAARAAPGAVAEEEVIDLVVFPGLVGREARAAPGVAGAVDLVPPRGLADRDGASAATLSFCSATLPFLSATLPFFASFTRPPFEGFLFSPVVAPPPPLPTAPANGTLDEAGPSRHAALSVSAARASSQLGMEVQLGVQV